MPWAMDISFLRSSSPLLVALSFLHIFAVLGDATILNRTIDDALGDSVTGPILSGPGWESRLCGGCAIKPNITQTFNHTYTAITFGPSENPAPNITMTFNGISIWVFFILANNAGSGVTTTTLANFSLDDNEPETFVHIPGSMKALNFSALAFSKTGLLSMNHTLCISPLGTKKRVYLNFDYAVYAHDDGQAPPTTISSDPSSDAPTLSKAKTITSSKVDATTSSKIVETTSLKIDGSSPSEPSTSKADAEKTPSSPTLGIILGCVGGAISVVILVFFVLFRRYKQRRNREMVDIRAVSMIGQRTDEGLETGESNESPPRYTKHAP